VEGHTCNQTMTTAPAAAAAAAAAALAEEDADGILLIQHEALGTDLSYLRLEDHSAEQYEASLQEKVQTLRALFQPYWSSALTVFRSPPMHHRLRAKFGIGRVVAHKKEEDEEQEEKEEEEDLGKVSKGTAAKTTTSTKLCYLMWGSDERPVAVSSFPLASRRINELMPRLLLALEAGPVVLRRGLRAVNFLDTLAGDTLISLMYQVPLLEGGTEGGEEGGRGGWAEAAGTWVRDGLGVQVVGRSKGRVVMADRAYVMEEFDLFPSSSSALPPSCEPTLYYKQWEGAFSNPNGHMAMHTLRWLCARADTILEAEEGREGESHDSSGRSKSNCDLLELYCGGGNHTVALSRKFRRVVGVEIDKRLVTVARENLALNGITNTTIIQIPSERFRVEGLGRYRRQQEQQERREKGKEAAAEGLGEEENEENEEQEVGEEEEGEDEDMYDFRVVLVDPPRAGLDRHTRKLVSQYEHVLYISCGPSSLLRDLRGENEEEQQQSSDKTFRSLAGFGLAQTHEVVDMCVLDHFPGTMHIEAAVHLRQRR